MLVALGAALFVRVIAGIGFLGAGTILKGHADEAGQHVKGLTTAAGLWMTAAIGVAAGLGPVLSTLLALAVFSVMPKILQLLEKDRG